MTSYEKEGEKSIILKRIRFASKNPFESLTTTNSYYYDFFQFTQICMGYRMKPKCSVWHVKAFTVQSLLTSQATLFTTHPLPSGM